MKILIASGTYPPQLGGMATFVERTGGYFRKRGELAGIVAYGETRLPAETGLLVHFVSRRGGAVARYLRYFWRVLRLAGSADFVYAQDLASSGLPAAAACAVSRKPLVLRLGGDFLWEKMVETKRTVRPLVEYYREPKSLQERVYLWSFGRILHRASAVIFNTALQAELYRRHFQLASEKIHLLPNAFEPLRVARPPVKRQMVFAGRFASVKNLENLLVAFSKSGVTAKLLLVGEGPQEQALTSLIAHLGLAGRVEMLQPLPRAALIKLFAESLAVVIPSLSELYPNTAMEALSAGAQVLLTRHHGLPAELREYLIEFDPLDISDMALKLGFAGNAAARGWAFVRPDLAYEVSWEEIGERQKEIFKKLLTA